MRTSLTVLAGLAVLSLNLSDLHAGEPGSSKTPTPTYYGNVLGILQTHCQDCHRPGEVAPFALMSYEQARKRATDLEAVTEERRMPPWHASTTEGGPFKDARVMSADEIKTVAAWVAAGCPEGEKDSAPPAKNWATSEWPLGTPDLVLAMPEAYKLAAEGHDEHRVFVVPTGLTEGKWVAAIDYRPGNPKVVHHVLAAFDTASRAKTLDKADPNPGYKVFGGFGIIPNGGLGGWAPGKRPEQLPAGVARYLPAGSDVLLQVHYHKSGKPETDVTKIGLYFSKAPVDKIVRGGLVRPAMNGGFLRPNMTIPANDANYLVTGKMTINEDSHLIGVAPHMHWLGKDFLLTATRPDGSKSTLIKIDHWDFNWQGTYDLATPIALPKGTKVEMTAHFDNSATNPANPTKPPVDVHWGEETNDEMCLGFLVRTFDDEHRKNKPPEPRPVVTPTPKVADGRP